jgi:tRNA nucleotidyltransferase (CCA-adding enzyme)
MVHKLAVIQPILEALVRAGGRPHVVGGAVRDLLRGLPVKDIDIEVYGMPIEQLMHILREFGRVDAVGRSFGVLKLRLPDGTQIDVALPRRESKIGAGHRGFLAAPDPTMTPVEAAARRDFTWNAMALTPEGELLDFFGGAADLSKNIIRHTTPAFAEDPLRVLRAMQFAARFDMELAPETAALSQQLLPEADTLAAERIWGEWQKWAAKSIRPSAGLRVLRETGWLALYPELVALIDCPQDPHYHPEGDVWVHTLFVCDAAATVAIRADLGEEERAVLLLAALCHDLGKPETTATAADGRIRSFGHAQAGLAPAAALLRRLGTPRAIVDRVLPLVAEHMAHYGMEASPRAVRRLAVRLAPATLAQWGRLVEADASGRPPRPPANPSAPFLALAEQLGAAHGQPAALVQGRHLMERGVAPGPQLGELLKRAYAAQIDGEFATLEEGLDWLDRSTAGE